MKAAFLVGPRELEIREIAAPALPADGLILEVRATGICGSDLRRWKEGPPEGVEGVVPGHEAAGVVEAVGDAVSRFAPGDRLAIAPDVHCGSCYYCERGLYNLCDDLRLVGITPGYPGGFAEKMVLPGEVLERGVVHRIPDGLPFVDAALSEPSSSVLASHDKACTSPEDVVVVMGAGPIGCLHVAVARARGARAVVSEPVAERREMAERFGPIAVVDPMNEDLDQRVRALTDGVGADIVICANPVAATQTEAVEIVRKGGRVVLFGGLPKADPMTKLDGNKIHYGEIEVVGAFSYHPTFHAMALDLLDRGLIPADLLVTDTFPLADIDRAFQVAASGEGLKLVVEASED
jgi:L-iditol 2-dehydrogenase